MSERASERASCNCTHCRHLMPFYGKSIFSLDTHSLMMTTMMMMAMMAMMMMMIIMGKR